MKLLKMGPGQHMCLVFSLAMLLDESVETLVQELGHDGMEILWKGNPPNCYRGHHIQEIIDVVIDRGYSLTPIEFFPRYASAQETTNWKALLCGVEAERRFINLITNRPGILIGRYHGRGHACAWDGSIVWDPNGYKYDITEFEPLECWIMASHHSGTS